MEWLEQTFLVKSGESKEIANTGKILHKQQRSVVVNFSKPIITKNIHVPDIHSKENLIIDK